MLVKLRKFQMLVFVFATYLVIIIMIRIKSGGGREEDEEDEESTGPHCRCVYNVYISVYKI